MIQTIAPQSLGGWLREADRCVNTWEARWGAYETHPSLRVEHETLSAAYETYVNRLAANYPFFHPRYAGQMLKPPHPGPFGRMYLRQRSVQAYPVHAPYEHVYNAPPG